MHPRRRPWHQHRLRANPLEPNTKRCGRVAAAVRVRIASLAPLCMPHAHTASLFASPMHTCSIHPRSHPLERTHAAHHVSYISAQHTCSIHPRSHPLERTHAAHHVSYISPKHTCSIQSCSHSLMSITLGAGQPQAVQTGRPARPAMEARHLDHLDCPERTSSR